LIRAWDPQFSVPVGHKVLATEFELHLKMPFVLATWCVPVQWLLQNAVN